MLLLEHNGKALFRKYQVPTPAGTVVRDENALAWTVTTMPPRLVLKAQIAGGGRSKRGGIAFVDGASEAREAFAALLGSHIDGHFVDAVLVEERIAFARERYAGILIDGGEIRLLFARIGGVDIEEITAADPANLASIAVDPIEGPATGQLRDCFERLGYATSMTPIPAPARVPTPECVRDAFPRAQIALSRCLADVWCAHPGGDRVGSSASGTPLR